VTSHCLPRVFALAPVGSDGVALAAAACRANSLGLLDLTSGQCPGLAEAFDRIGKLTARPFGVRTLAQEVLSQLALEPEIHSPAVMCIPVGTAEPDRLPEVARLIHAANRVAIAEVTTRADAGRARSAGFDGLILSGHESGGWCGPESSFVLLQGVLAETDLPVWVRGGIGPSVAAGCLAAGAAGVVLDGALLLSRESPLSPQRREQVSRCDGSESVVVVPRSHASLRVFATPGSEALDRSSETSAGLTASALPRVKTRRSPGDCLEGLSRPVGSSRPSSEPSPRGSPARRPPGRSPRALRWPSIMARVIRSSTGR
jgi:NAD(P)H-dependent flavin oxidoreductase YrpB (nitropropane dioxygenase family)